MASGCVRNFPARLGDSADKDGLRDGPKTMTDLVTTSRHFGFLYVFGTIFFTVYGQIVLKWRINLHGDLPGPFTEKISFLFHLLLDPFIFSGFLSAVIASFFWMAAMTKFELSYAYPFIALSFVLVFFFSAWFFNESVTAYKVVGLILIVAGILVTSRGL